MNADAKFDPPIRRNPSIALDEPVLHFDGAACRVDHAAEFDDRTVASALDDAAMMSGDGGLDEIAPQRAEARKRPALVDAGEPAYPTTSWTRIAASLRVPLITLPSSLQYWHS